MGFENDAEAALADPLHQSVAVADQRCRRQHYQVEVGKLLRTAAFVGSGNNAESECFFAWFQVLPIIN